ncbi:MAG: ferredoxin/flavodoxin---NADP+ reductase [Thermoleophilaceae bacterium]|jgi:ferredoxin--NADP+ reductase|nr:ferredoxin/flavodoxin---NADP+ reductase [Thermoleophilaceae bacterium]
MTPEETLRVAIVGAGPAGFYAAGHLLAADRAVEVDLFDRLPTPFGLVRAGVAPDHPKIKSVVRVYEKTAAKEGFRFFGGIELGRDLHRTDLLERYHAVVYAIGAATDRRLGIPGEDLPGSEAATNFVGWYNGHPDHVDAEFELDTERVVVVGNGNVAIDCARMLALSVDELQATDTADYAIEPLASDSVKEIVILGRRGPAQAAFTNPELLELGELEQADVIVDPADLELDDASAAWLESDAASKTARENVRILREYAAREPAGKPKRIVLRFLTSPVELRGDERVEEIVVERNRLEPREDGSLAARPTGERETIETGLVLRSIGYKGIAIPEMPFDASQGTIPNMAGRVIDGEQHLTGEYVTGWIRRGPSGVIGTNKKDGQEAAGSVLADAEAGMLNAPSLADSDIAELLQERGAEPVGWDGWKRIDEHELQLGTDSGRPRVKLARYEELLGAARGTAAGKRR